MSIMGKWIVLGLIVGLVVGTFATCSNQIKQGPFEFEKPKLNLTLTVKHVVSFIKVKIIKDVQLTTMYRSYWKSYCYNGGSLDPNTGCFAGETQDLPNYQESQEWIKKDQCLAPRDYIDYWGKDSDLCLQPDILTKEWINKKELRRIQNNNHFPFHTCNLSWRCGINTSEYPTFLIYKDHRWTAYTVFSNGTKFDVDLKDFWQFNDIVIRKTVPHVIKFEDVKLSCFSNAQNETSCYDADEGVFFKLENNHHCHQRVCYSINENLQLINKNKDKTGKSIIENLNAASISDLKGVIATEHMLSEEMRYNFGKLSEEVIELRKILLNIILSVAKVDDKLIGNVMGHSARSQFLSEETFLLSPCAEPIAAKSNCMDNQIFKNGRWMERKDESECLSLNSVNLINPFKQDIDGLWLPKLKDQEILGTAQNLDGWSYYANEKDNLERVMQWTTNGQQTTSLSDLYDLPKGIFNNILSGFLASQLTTYLGMGILSIIVYRKICTRNNESFNINRSEIGHAYPTAPTLSLFSMNPRSQSPVIQMQENELGNNIYSRRPSMKTLLNIDNEGNDFGEEEMLELDFQDKMEQEEIEQQEGWTSGPIFLRSPRLKRRGSRYFRGGKRWRGTGRREIFY